VSAMARRVEPEWLDTLAPEDARAARSRRDLARVNALMGNAGIVAGALRDLAPGALRLAELGAGDGRFTARWIARLEGRTGRVVLVDRAPCVDAQARRAIESRGWEVQVARADVFEWLTMADPGFDAICANLFLHHFDDASLARLLAGVSQRTRRFVACEPRRSAFALAGSRLLGLLGCNDVTRHDAVLSVRAGFSGGEISTLWRTATRDGWSLHEGARALFSHAFVARRA